MGRVPTISLVRPTPCRARKLSEFLLCIIGLPSLLRPLALQASQRLHRRARLTPLETEVTCALNSDRLQSEPSIKKTTIKKTWQESRVLDVRKLGVLRPRAQENRQKSTKIDSKSQNFAPPARPLRPRGLKAPLATHADFSACGRLAGRCAADRRAAGRRAA